MIMMLRMTRNIKIVINLIMVLNDMCNIKINVLICFIFYNSYANIFNTSYTYLHYYIMVYTIYINKALE